jgi:menaquinol-cytochrome c reductase iron-sulfur subunit
MHSSGEPVAVACESADQMDCDGCLQKGEVQVSRRAFFASLLGVCSGAIASVVGLPLLRYILYPVRSAAKASKWTLIGDAREFENIAKPVTKTVTLTQRDGWREVVSAQAVYVTRSAAGQLKVLSPICPHLGCSVSWHENQGKFICPCHGGHFSADGSRLSGPPPRGLDQLDVQIRDGKLEVQFQYFRSNVPDRQLLG